MILPWRCGDKEPRRLSQDWIGHRAVGFALDFGHPNGGEYVRGTDILAPMGGSVTKGYIRGENYGNWVKIDAGNGWSVLLAHLAEPSPAPSTVKTGDVVGHVGSSGTEIPHIHVEVRLNNGMPDTNQITRIFGHPRDDFLYAPNKPFYSNNCGGPVPTINIRWGDSAWGINLNRRVLVQVRPFGSSTDLFKQVVQTDNTGTYNGLILTGVSPGWYDVFIKPQGLLRQQSRRQLNWGANTPAIFSLSKPGTDCSTRQPLTGKPLIGDINGDNVINVSDYNLILTYYNKPLPPNYSDLDGNGTITGVDYNLWFRSTCYFGRDNPPSIVGDGGRETSPLVLAATASVSKSHLTAVNTIPTGRMSLSPLTGTYRISDYFTVDVVAHSSGLLLNGTDAVINYDSAVLRVNSLTAGTIFPQTPVLANDSQKGEISISGIADQNQPRAVNGVLARIEFQVVGPGLTSVAFDYIPGSTAHTGMVEYQTGEQVLGFVDNASYTVATLRVPENYPTIAQALQDAMPSEAVLVSPGTYHERISVPANVTLQGTNPNTTIVDGDGVNGSAVVYLDSGATISGLSVQHGGSNFWDAAIWAGESATITNNRISNSSMGIVRYCFSAPCADTSIITNNLVTQTVNAGIVVHGARAQVENNTVVYNQSQGITFEAAGSQGTIANNIVTNNQTGIAAASATTLVHNLLWLNSADYQSGTSPGADDFVANPLFTTVGNNTYHLHAASPAHNSLDGDLGAYPFVSVGTAPTNFTVTQAPQELSLSWNGTGTAGYFLYIAQDPNFFFSQPINVGTATSYSFRSLMPGRYQFAVSSYNSQGQESSASYAETSISPSTISGRVTDNQGNPISDVSIEASFDDEDFYTSTAADGTYQLDSLPGAIYRVRPSKAGYTFSPDSRTDISVPPNAIGVDFVGAVAPSNLLQNASFEDDSNPADGKPDTWSTNNKFTRLCDPNTIQPMDGTCVGRFRATDNSGATIQQTINNLTANTPYAFSGWTNIPATTDAFTFKYQVQWRNASNSTIRTDTIAPSYTDDTNGTWQHTSKSLLSPAGTANAIVKLVVSSLNGTIYVDRLMFGKEDTAGDTQPPSAPTNMQATSTSSTQVDLTWVAATDNIGVTGYDIYRDGVLLMSVGVVTSISDTSVVANTTYGYAVKAKDAAGNISNASNTATVTTSGSSSNLLKNPGFEESVNIGWSTSSKFMQSSTQHHSDTHAGRFYATDNSGVTVSQTVASGLTAGTTYTSGCWANIPTQNDSTFTLKLQVQWRNASNSTIRTDTITTYNTATSGWNSQSIKGVIAPAGTAKAIVKLVVTSLNGEMFVDDCVLQPQ